MMQIQLQKQMMETSISHELVEGEELIWSGRPLERGKGIASPARNLFIVGLVYAGIGLVAMLVLFGVTLGGSGFGDGISFFMLIPGGIFFVLGLALVMVSQKMSFVPKTAFYAITNRRAIISQGGRYVHVTSYDVRSMNQIQRLERPDGSGDLIFVGGQTSTGNSAISTAGRQGMFSAISDVRLAEQKLLGVMGRK